MLEQLECYSGQARGCALATGEDKERGVCVELLQWHSHSFLTLNNVRQEIRMVFFGSNATVNFRDIQGEDFVLSRFHRLWDHHFDELV